MDIIEQKSADDRLLSPVTYEFSDQDIAFLNWFEDTFLKGNTTFPNKVAKYISPFLAAPANLIAYFLGNDLSH